METLELLRRRLESTERLHGVVRTMKILSLTSIRQYEDAVAALETYARTVEMGLQIVLRHRPYQPAASRRRRFRHLGALVFGSAQGMCGRFNEEVATYAAGEIDAAPVQRATVLALGGLVTGPLEGQNRPAAQIVPVPESVEAITATVQELVWTIERWRAEEAVDQVVLYYNKLHTATAYDPYSQQLFPLDAVWLERLRQRGWPARTLPTFTMEADALFSALLRQYTFVSLFRAFAESLASEHASRLTAMQVAEDNIEQRLDQLQGDYHRQRQSTITMELLDIVSGFEALTTAPT